MTSWLAILNLIFALGGLFLLALAVFLYIDYFIFSSRYFRLGKKLAWPAIIMTTVGSTMVSLLYSEYYGFVPCSLCWLQRIAMYPQALLSPVAFKTKDRVHFPLYSIVLSTFGLLIAIYQYIYQMVPKEVLTNGVLPCLADGTADCAAKVIDEFGFITLPFLSAVTFAFLIIIYLNLRHDR